MAKKTSTTTNKPKVEWPEYIKTASNVIIPYIDELKRIALYYTENETLEKDDWIYAQQCLIKICENSDQNASFNTFVLEKVPEKYSTAKRTLTSLVRTKAHCKYFLNGISKYEVYEENDEDKLICILYNMSCHLYYFITSYSLK